MDLFGSAQALSSVAPAARPRRVSLRWCYARLSGVDTTRRHLGATPAPRFGETNPFHFLSITDGSVVFTGPCVVCRGGCKWVRSGKTKPFQDGFGGGKTGGTPVLRRKHRIRTTGGRLLREDATKAKFHKHVFLRNEPTDFEMKNMGYPAGR
jgi:hypothetical protein